MARLGVPLASLFVLFAGVLAFASPDDIYPPDPVTTALNPGVVYTFQVTDLTQSPPQVDSMEVVVEGRSLKMTAGPGAGPGAGPRAAPRAGAGPRGPGSSGEMIFNGDRREMIAVDHDTESYMLFDLAAITALGGQTAGANSQIDAMLEQVPEAQRAAVREMLERQGQIPGAGMPQAEPTRLVNTGERATKAGYPCVKYEVWRGDQKLRELWVTDWDNVEGGEEAEGAFTGIADFFQEMVDAAPEGSPMSATADQFRFWKEIDGFPVVTNEFDGDDLSGETTLRSARLQTIDPDAFNPPSHYERQEMFGR